MSESLLEKYGGFATISGIVHSFYEKVMDEDSLRPYFQGIDMERLARHQTDFLTMVFGGPVSYSRKALRESHSGLSIVEEDFDCVVDLLEEALEEAAVEDADIAEVMKVIVSYKNDIVSA
ncbi:MAG: group 1 truncated hemoglobin [Holophagales bacterium]|nr:group 1 truncated hemoglobin [Holophagales bacterium]